jgi:DNA invertase Pin-like site-specific DNA recombinase
LAILTGEKVIFSASLESPLFGEGKQPHSQRFFATPTKGELMRVALYARVSTHDQQTLPLQMEGMREYASRRGWLIVREVTEVGSGAKVRPEREALMKAARRREIDAVLVWRLDRWGRSLPDLVVSLKELTELGVGFLSLNEALDLTTPTGRAMAGLLAVFAEFERDILKERVKAGIAQSRAKGKPHGRPATTRTQQQKARSSSLREAVNPNLPGAGYQPQFGTRPVARAHGGDDGREPELR